MNSTFKQNDLLLMEWAKSNIDSIDFANFVLSKIILGLSTFNEVNNGNIKQVNLLEFNKNDGIINELTVFSLYNIKMWLVNLGNGNKSENKNDISVLILGNNNGESKRILPMTESEPGIYYFNHESLRLFYKELIQKYIEVIAHIYLLDESKIKQSLSKKFSKYHESWGDEAIWNFLIFSKVLTKAKYLEMENEGISFDVPACAKYLWVVRFLDSFTDKINQDIYAKIGLKYGVPDYEKHKKILKIKRHPKINAVKNFFIEIAPFLIFVCMCGFLILIFTILAYLVDLL